MISVIALFTIVSLLSFKFNKNTFNTDILAYEKNISIRGICAVEIMIGHLGLELKNELILQPFCRAGLLVVGVFFFLSGYGLSYSFLNKKNYLHGFLQKRLTSILIPVGLFCLLSIIFLYLTSNVNSGKGLIIEVIKSINWYIWEIIVLYLLFFILFKFFNETAAISILFVICVIYIILAYGLNMFTSWYASTLCFPFGILIGMNSQKFFVWCKRHYLLKFLISCTILILSILCFYILPTNNPFSAIVSKNVAALSFTLLLLMILLKMELGNKCVKFLGKISFEIYLIHPLIIELYHSNLFYIRNNLAFSYAVILTTICVAYVIMLISCKMKYFVNKGVRK